MARFAYPSELDLLPDEIDRLGWIDDRDTEPSLGACDDSGSCTLIDGEDDHRRRRPRMP